MFEKDTVSKGSPKPPECTHVYLDYAFWKKEYHQNVAQI